MKNEAIQALTYTPVLAPEGVPKAVTFHEDGTLLRLRFDHAKTVEALVGEERYAFHPVDGIWELNFPPKTAINYVQLLVDGDEVLSPYLPIGYGYSRPYNYVEQPVEDSLRWKMEGVRHGTIHHELIYSMTTGTYERCVVYTPYGYESSQQDYPVLYLQHGHGENEIGWSTAGKVQFIMDGLLAEKKATPCIIVMNNGMVQLRDEHGEPYVDHLMFERFLLDDVMPVIESKYRVRKERRYRAVAGLSMGSIQATILAFNHPKLFGSLGVFSGFLHDWIQGSELDTNDRGPSENRHLDCILDAVDFSQRYEVFFRGIGREDPFLEHFLGDDAMLSEAGISCTRKMYEGTHDWNVWRVCIYDFLQMIFQ